MKKKVRRFSEGGGRFDEDTYSRAKAFLRLQNIADTPALDELAPQGRTRTYIKDIEGEVPLTRTSTVENEVPVPRPDLPSLRPRSTRVADVASSDSIRQILADDEASRAIAHAGSEAGNLSRIRAARDLQNYEPTVAAPTLVSAGSSSNASQVPRRMFEASRPGIQARRADAAALDAAERHAAAVRSLQESGPRSGYGPLGGPQEERGRARIEARRAAAAEMDRTPKEAPAPKPPKKKLFSDRARKLRNPSGDTEYRAKGGVVGSASKRGDGIAQRGKTRGRFL